MNRLENSETLISILPSRPDTYTVRANRLAYRICTETHTHRLRLVSQTAVAQVLVSCPIVSLIDIALFQSLTATRTFWLSSFYLFQTKTRPEPQHRNITYLEKSAEHDLRDFRFTTLERWLVRVLSCDFCCLIFFALFKKKIGVSLALTILWTSVVVLME